MLARFCGLPLLPFDEPQEPEQLAENKNVNNQDSSAIVPLLQIVDLNSSNHFHHQLQDEPIPVDSTGSIQPSAQNFLVDSTSSILSSKVSMVTIATEELLAQVPCGHIFHKECILEWANHNDSCPVCRKSLTYGLIIGEKDVTVTDSGIGRLGNSLIDE